MRDGNYTYYTIQHRRTGESEWLKPDGPIKPCREKEWINSSHDSFLFHPRRGTKSRDEAYQVWLKTEHRGWWSLKLATEALGRAVHDSAIGFYDDKGPYGERCQAVRYEFRIVKMTVSQKTETV